MSTRLKHIWRGWVLAAVACALPTIGQAQVAIESGTFAGLRARAIGPAVMSGRIAAIDAVADNPVVIYAGAATGGVWKSDDGGITFEPIFDDHTMSIGAVRIDPSNPDIIWVGTGESWTRNSVSVGDGVYKSTDGGDSWEYLGLEDSERIARIAVNPQNGDVAFVCATGHLWNSNEQRGVFRTTDGGATWEKVLYVDEDTGCSDITMDPHAPNILFAGMWEFRRWPWFFNSGGPGSGLYRSIDGGDTWQELTDGLPDGEKGRIAVAIAPSKPNVVYAVVEADTTALYRSNDMGASWENVNESFNVQVRPFYFAYVVPDPKDPEKVYKPGLSLTVSTDGGESFSNMFTSAFGGTPHSDHHALWINPRRTNELILGTDGGVYFSYDGGNTWRLSKALPVSQFYEISYDMEVPYNVYGGLQDNGTWRGPSQSPGGVQAKDWDLLFGGDGFHVFVDPADPDYIYVEYQGGNLQRITKTTGESKQIQPFSEEEEDELRFNWNTPIHVSPNNPGTLYIGAQYLFRTRDRGDSWTRVSPDLTTDDEDKQNQEESGGLTKDNSSAENHTTIYTISESPLDATVIWVGTDDGNLQVTRDDGANWTNTVGNVPDLPDNTWVTHVEAGKHDAGTAYVTFDGHKTGDMTTYVYRTRDFGRSWESLVTDNLEGYALVIEEDSENPDLLFLGTEFGLWISVDGGHSWARYETEFPKVGVRDLAIHSRDNDLIIGTHGRGIWILDDITPLRALTPEVLAAELAILPTGPNVQTIGGGQGAWFPGNDEFVGRNPSEAAAIVYYQAKRHIFGDMIVEVYDGDELITELAAGKVRGINRVDWPMRYPPPKMPPSTTLVPVFSGPLVPEGTYTFKIIKGRNTYEGEIELIADPRNPHSAEDRQLQQETALEIYDMLERLSYIVDVTIDLSEQARERAAELSGGAANRLEEYAEELEEWKGNYVAEEGGYATEQEKLREHLGNLFGSVNGYAGRPTDSELQRMAQLEAELAEAERQFAELTSEDELSRMQRDLEGSELEPLKVMTREEWEEEKES
ncbi:MAG: glycosyl hydrolase [Gemmatimonadetes bacterium]|uniref:Glycosyl hydrolase n=1 Tax=Candidatus Kutchimonas denitrificans TaxID=3056748 RepID=A0AAE5CDJ2_9BACT|nr:glycosyl hydrolase [Gemmatimonadota bacterium]NIR75884.1 glycosyl hydrolase [Candidatus Kutchimonas denitrificans]NIS00396.1 glycosyl hydrolase [Gemmatimonadota bacterium]NIT66060.1 glycosyl hydrolase [Gemmatimonadota bacterium]NIU54814.1 glycosyl hydrolase [Gemmatimonadota bacterium]